MITFLEGILRQSLPTQVVIDVHGVGYEVHIPLSTYEAMPAVGDRARLLTQLIVREDAHLLYGFHTDAERDLFRLLVTHVSGVGPKLACAVLSGMPVAMFKTAVADGDTVSLARISGLGKKTAERIVLELKDKLGVTASWKTTSPETPALTGSERQFNDTVLALVTLGYRQPEAVKAVREAIKQAGESPDAETLLRAALRQLA